MQQRNLHQVDDAEQAQNARELYAEIQMYLRRLAAEPAEQLRVVKQRDQGRLVPPDGEKSSSDGSGLRVDVLGS